VPLLGILVTHEFGHYFAAKIHGVRASLPYFIPMPFSPFGTFGAVIGMPDRIPSRRQLLDIGAAGPLAGLVVALPVVAWGLAHSEVKPLTPHGLIEGQSILYWLMKKAFVPQAIGPGEDVYLHPTAFAGWAGLFVTMLNLIPVGQTDGGHIAYALFGKKQDRYAPWIRNALLPLFVYNAGMAMSAQRVAGYPEGWFGYVTANSSSWLVWWVLLGVLARVGGGNHPPIDDDHEPLGPVRKTIAIVSLVLFGLLFMRVPFIVT
jgi:membrane-associated protease RseP (regulator of RpoE activity)